MTDERVRDFQVLKGETKHIEQFMVLDDLRKFCGYVHYGTYDTEIKVGDHYCAVEGRLTPEKIPPEALVQLFIEFVNKIGCEWA